MLWYFLMLNSVAVFSSTLYLHVGNPTLYVGNNAVPVGVGTPPLDITTPLWKIMVSSYLQNLFEKLPKLILQNTCMEPNLPVYSSWKEHCLYAAKHWAFFFLYKPTLCMLQLVKSLVLGRSPSITTTSTSCSLLMLQTPCTSQTYLLNVHIFT